MNNEYKHETYEPIYKVTTLMKIKISILVLIVLLAITLDNITAILSKAHRRLKQ